MDIFDKARRLEQIMTRRLTGAAKSLTRRGDAREPIELAHAIVEAVEGEVQAADRGSRVFPFNTIHVSIVATSDHERARIEAIVNGGVSLRSRIMERLHAAGCTGVDLDVGVRFVPRGARHWTDPQFAIAFSRMPRKPRDEQAPELLPPRIEVTVVHGTAERRTYAFASHRIDIGRGSEVRDSRNGLVRTNHVAFSEGISEVNRSVSRRHSHIEYDPASAEFRLHDDGSVHGTRILRRGKTVPVALGPRGVRLQSGDDIALGDARVRVKFEVARHAGRQTRPS